MQLSITIFFTFFEIFSNCFYPPLLSGCNQVNLIRFIEKDLHNLYMVLKNVGLWDHEKTENADL